MKEVSLIAGIGVSIDRLDVTVRPTGQPCQVPYDPVGITPSQIERGNATFGTARSYRWHSIGLGWRTDSVSVACSGGQP